MKLKTNLQKTTVKELTELFKTFVMESFKTLIARLKTNHKIAMSLLSIMKNYN